MNGNTSIYLKPTYPSIEILLQLGLHFLAWMRILLVMHQIKQEHFLRSRFIGGVYEFVDFIQLVRFYPPTNMDESCR